MVDMAVRVASRASASTLSEHEESELMVNPRGLYAGLKAASESFSFWCFCAAVAASMRDSDYPALCSLVQVT